MAISFCAIDKRNGFFDSDPLISMAPLDDEIKRPGFINASENRIRLMAKKDRSLE